MYKKLAAWAATAVLACSSAHAAELGIASFNLAWAGTTTDFAKHLEVCSAKDVNWCDTRAKTTAPAELARAEKCQQAFDAAAGGPASGMFVAPCNAYKAPPGKLVAAGVPAYEAKLERLRETIDSLITTHRVDVLAFQEVKSRDAVLSTLGKHAAQFDVCVASHSAFQTLAFAWRKDVTTAPGQCQTEAALAIKEKPGDPSSLKTVRPGLAVELNIGGQPVTILNVHLKSACANLNTGGGFPGRKLTDADPACAVLNRQVLPLETWLDASVKKSPLVVLLGDFNRRLDEEAAAAVAANAVRVNKTDPASPNAASADGTVTTQYLWQELSDGEPKLVQVPLATTTSACTGFVGLDHIVITDALSARQKSPPTSTKVPVPKKPSDLIVGSDHCPRITRLTI